MFALPGNLFNGNYLIEWWHCSLASIAHYNSQGTLLIPDLIIQGDLIERWSSKVHCQVQEFCAIPLCTSLRMATELWLFLSRTWHCNQSSNKIATRVVSFHCLCLIVCFDCERSLRDMKSFFFCTLLDWSLVLPSCSCLSLLDLIDHCNLGSWFLPL